MKISTLTGVRRTAAPQNSNIDTYAAFQMVTETFLMACEEQTTACCARRCPFISTQMRAGTLRAGRCRLPPYTPEPYAADQAERSGTWKLIPSTRTSGEFFFIMIWIPANATAAAAAAVPFCGGKEMLKLRGLQADDCGHLFSSAGIDFNRGQGEHETILQQGWVLRQTKDREPVEMLMGREPNPYGRGENKKTLKITFRHRPPDNKNQTRTSFPRSLLHRCLSLPNACTYMH